MQAEANRHAGLAGRGLAVALVLLSSAAPGAAATSEAAAADPAMGRLFMTPAERSALDARRTGSDKPTPAAAPQPAVASPEQVVLSGVLTRSRGPDVVWINGKASGPQASTARVQAGADAPPRVTVADAAAGASATLKPGQVWTPRTGKVGECLGCRAAGPAPEDARAAGDPGPAATPADPPAPPTVDQADTAARPDPPP